MSRRLSGVLADHLLPRRLPRGRSVLDVDAVDTAYDRRCAAPRRQPDRLDVA